MSMSLDRIVASMPIARLLSGTLAIAVAPIAPNDRRWDHRERSGDDQRLEQRLHTPPRILLSRLAQVGDAFANPAE